MIVSFEVLFKTPVTANEGLAKLRDAVDNNKRLGNFTVETLKIIQPVNPTTAASTEGSTSTVCNSSQKGDLTVKNDIHIKELLQSRHRWQQEHQESNRFNNNNKKTHLLCRWIKKIIYFFPTLHGYVKFPDAIFYSVRSKNRTEIFLSHSELGCWIQFQERPSSILIRWLSWYKRDLLYERKHIHLINVVLIVVAVVVLQCPW